jgi:uncharacterized protein YjiS (DUF1127 family)
LNSIMNIIAQLRRGLTFARTYDSAFWALEGMSDRQLAGFGIGRAEIWRVADHLARETAARAAR